MLLDAAVVGGVLDVGRPHVELWNTADRLTELMFLLSSTTLEAEVRAAVVKAFSVRFVIPHCRSTVE